MPEHYTEIVADGERVTVTTGGQKTVYRSKDDSSSGAQVAILHGEISMWKDRVSELESLIRDVIRGDWCVTDLQEAIGDV